MRRLCVFLGFFSPIADIFVFSIDSGGKVTLCTDFSSHGMFSYMQQAIVLALICATHIKCV